MADTENYDFQLELYPFNPDIADERGSNKAVASSIKAKKLSKDRKYKIIRVGMYIGEDKQVKYFDIDQQPYTENTRHDDLTALLPSELAKNSRIYFQGHASGSADGIKGDVIEVPDGEEHHHSEMITNDVLANIVNTVNRKLAPEASLHVSFQACNFDNKQQVSAKQETNFERFFKKLDISSRISARGSAPHDKSDSDSGKTSAQKNRKLVGGKWKSTEGRHIMFHYEYTKGIFIPAKTNKPSLLSTKKTISQKRKLLDLLSQSTELLVAHKIISEQAATQTMRAIALKSDFFDPSKINLIIDMLLSKEIAESDEALEIQSALDALQAEGAAYAKAIEDKIIEHIINKVALLKNAPDTTDKDKRLDLITLLLKKGIPLHKILGTQEQSDECYEIASIVLHRSLFVMDYSVGDGGMSVLLNAMQANNIDFKNLKIGDVKIMHLLGLKLEAIEILAELGIIGESEAKEILMINIRNCNNENVKFISEKFPQVLSENEAKQAFILAVKTGNLITVQEVSSHLQFDIDASWYTSALAELQAHIRSHHEDEADDYAEVEQHLQDNLRVQPEPLPTTKSCMPLLASFASTLSCLNPMRCLQKKPESKSPTGDTTLDLRGTSNLEQPLLRLASICSTEECSTEGTKSTIATFKYAS